MCQPSGLGPRRSQQSQRKEPRKIIATVSLNEDVKLNKAEKAWKPSSKRASEEEDPENIKTQVGAGADGCREGRGWCAQLLLTPLSSQELLRRVRSILNKLTPQMFQQLMKQVMELSIDTEERLKGVIDLVFEKAISEPNFSVAYANMCRCLMGVSKNSVGLQLILQGFVWGPWLSSARCWSFPVGWGNGHVAGRPSPEP